MIERVKNFIFDYSGTLRDDLDWTFAITRRVFEKLGCEPISLEEYRNQMCLPYMSFYGKYLPNIGRGRIDQVFFRCMDEVGRPEPRLYPGVRETLEQLAERSIRMTILSSYFHYELLRELDILDIKKYFPIVFGGVHDKVAKISSIVSALDFDVSKTMVVGDMAHDIAAGKSIGATTVGLSWGYYPRERLEREASPDYIIDSLPEILLL